jgi:hypothetical protein
MLNILLLATGAVQSLLKFIAAWELDCVWNMMAHAQKSDFVFQWNERVHLNRRGCQFSRLLAAEVCASAVVMLETYTMFRGSVKSTGYPLHSPGSPSLPLPASPCTITFQLDFKNFTQCPVFIWSTEMYRCVDRFVVHDCLKKGVAFIQRWRNILDNKSPPTFLHSCNLRYG